MHRSVGQSGWALYSVHFHQCKWLQTLILPAKNEATTLGGTIKVRQALRQSETVA